MKRKAIFLMALVVGLSLTACEKSPEQKLVAQKNQERLEAAAKEEPKEGSTLKDVAATASAIYEYHYENEAGTVKIDANQAPVTIPLKDSIPMYHVYCGEFTQELVDKVYDYFFPDGEAYVTTGTDFTKDDCEKRILEFKQTIANIRDDEELTESEREEIIAYHEEMIASLEETMKDTPEESTLEFVKKDSTLEEQEWDGVNGSFTTRGFHVTSRDQKKWLTVDSCDEECPVASSVNYIRQSEYSYSGDAGVPVSKCTEDEKSQIGITEEESRAIADDFFQKIGVDVEVHDAMLVQGYRAVDSEEPDGTMIESENYTAYRFVYAQCVDGIEMAVTSSSYVPDKDDTSLTWLYEQISVIVDKDGIISLDWFFPQMIEDTVSENVGIISFEEASDIFEQMMPLTTQGDLEQFSDDNVQTSADVTVTDVRLGLMRVRSSGSNRRGLLTPVWLFYGDYTRNFHYLDGDWEDHSDTESYPWILLAVNAVDGSVIDITAGY